MNGNFDETKYGPAGPSPEQIAEMSNKEFRGFTGYMSPLLKAVMNRAEKENVEQSAPAAPAKAENVNVAALKAEAAVKYREYMAALTKYANAAKVKVVVAKNWVVYSYQTIRDWFRKHMFWAAYVPCSIALVGVTLLASPLAAQLAAVGIMAMSIAEFGLAHENYKLTFVGEGPGADTNREWLASRRTNEIVKMGTSITFAAVAVARLVAFAPTLGLMAGVGALLLGLLVAVMTDGKHEYEAPEYQSV